ncbi:MAG: hypothetical protein IAG10_24545 [Planctomycetaceae bacterium]|nr:hypothetical protein [Planctomycetaceae bacterium]
MRAPFRFIAIPCVLLVLSAFVASLPAQQPTGKTTPRPFQPQAVPSKAGPAMKSGPITQTGGQANIGAKPSRPTGEPLVVQPVSPELRQILDDWEQHSSQIKSLHGKHTRFLYNHVFEIEKRSNGKWYLETPDKGRIDLVGIPPKLVGIPPKKEVSRKIGKQSGHPYRIEPDQEQMWICNGDEILIGNVNGDEKTYEVAPVPPHLRGTNIVNGPLPFLFGMKAVDAQKRYELTLLSNDKSSVKIRIVPRFQTDRDNYKMAEIILEKARYLPTAVRLLDPTENVETVYLFEIIDVNDRSLRTKLGTIFGGDIDPFRPDMKKKGYKLVLQAQEETDNPRLNANPRPNVKDGRPINTQPASRTAANPASTPRNK